MDGNRSISPENIPCINFLLHVIQTDIIAIGDDGLTLCFECCKIVDYMTAKECAAVFQGWLVNDDLGTFGFDAFHNPLNG